MHTINCQFGDSLLLSKSWRDPIVIISDGPYGLNSYKGDLRSPTQLPNFYLPHIKEWTKRSSALTTLWFWNTEVGWANVHPVLEKHGWIYRSCNIWDKGIAHAAGNTNTKTLRKFPVVTEVCAHYVRQPVFKLNQNNSVSLQSWLNQEWRLTGLPFSKANEACGVKNAATRKYLTEDHNWYMPPAKTFSKLVEYANEYGNERGKPYFSVDGMNSLTPSQWDQLRATFHCPVGVTNVWRVPALRGEERLKSDSGVLHMNQKPLALNKLIIEASSDENDVIWEPFGGLCSASIMARRLNRQSYCAEIDEDVFKASCARIFNEEI